MATIINSSKLAEQMFKCYNCGRKTVSSALSRQVIKNVEASPKLNIITFLNSNNDLDEVSVLEALEALQDEWLASCKSCGWSDS